MQEVIKKSLILHYNIENINQIALFTLYAFVYVESSIVHMHILLIHIFSYIIPQINTTTRKISIYESNKIEESLELKSVEARKKISISFQR